MARRMAVLMPHFWRPSRPVRNAQTGKYGPYLPKLHSVPIGSTAMLMAEDSRATWPSSTRGARWESHAASSAAINNLSRWRSWPLLVYIAELSSSATERHKTPAGKVRGIDLVVT